MKILAVSLLRVGDLIMHSMLIESIRKEFPNCELHLLTNEVNIKYAKTLSGLDRAIVFPRNLIQKYLVEDTRPLLKAYNELKTVIHDLNSQSYDLALNLTHNLVSAKLLDLINASEKRGIYFENGTRNILRNNQWLTYFNDHFSSNKKAQFHYLENLAESLSLKPPMLLEADMEMEKRNRISLQILTSDVKKNWPIKNFIELASLLRKEFSNKKITILGAPDEEGFLREKFQSIPGIDFKFESWSALDKIISESALLITCDTSVQHFAAKRRTSILSLFMGSANPTKTAPYLDDAVILQATQNCSPCRHSEKCWKPSIECAEDISVDDVFRTAIAMINKTEFPLTHSKLQKVQKRMNGRFHLVRAKREYEMINFQSAFEQTVWEIFVNREHFETAAPFGSFSHLLMEEFIQPFGSSEIKKYLQNRLQKCEMNQVFAEELHKEIISSIRNGSCFDSALDTLNSFLIGNKDTGDYFHLIKEELHSEKIGFQKAKALSTSIQEPILLLKIEHKLIRTLLTEMTEREIQYGKGFRKALETSSAAT